MLGIRANARFLIPGILLCAFTCPVAPAQANAKNVLLLFSFFDRNHVSQDNVEPSLRAHVPWPVNFSVAYLENSQLEDRSYRDSLAETFRRQYNHTKLNLILAVSVRSISD